MTRIRVKGFHIFRDRHGKTRCYHRATKIAVDLQRYPLGSAGFFSECARIGNLHGNDIGGSPGTLGALIRSFKQSNHWSELRPKTREFYESVFLYLMPINNTALIAFSSPLIVKIRDKAVAQRTWYFGNQLKTTLSVVFGWGKERGFIDENPAQGIRKLKRPKDLPYANRPWSDDERFTVMADAPAHEQAAYALMLYMGMDPIDAIKLPKTAYDGAYISYGRAKTTNRVARRVPEALRQILDGMPVHDAITLLANSRGKPWTKSGLSAVWQKRRKRLEAEGRIQQGLTMKGLRHTKATILKEMGMDDRTIADVLAQDTEAMARWYSKDADLKLKMEAVTEAFDAEEKRRVTLANLPEKVANLK
jgi:integrase